MLFSVISCGWNVACCFKIWVCLKNAKQNAPMAAFWRTEASSSFSAHGGDFRHKEAKFVF